MTIPSIKTTLATLAMLATLSSCQLLSPDEVKNPNVAEADFISSADAMKTWVNGSNARFAVGLSTLAENLGLLSDDLYNNSSRSSKTWDRLEIYYTDGEISKITTRLGEMIEMANFGLNTLAHKDQKTTDAQCFNLCLIKACAFLMAGENFVALPKSAHGEVLESDELIAEALQTLDLADTYIATDSDQALTLLLKARAYRLLGQYTQARQAALASLDKAPALLMAAQYDEINEVSNTVQMYISQNLFTIPARLSAQSAKFPLADLNEQPLPYAKSEEAWLIAAECALMQDSLAEARTCLKSLLALGATRSAAVTILTHSAEEIEAADAKVDLLTLLYTLRQEALFGEGRRASDLGFRLPISEVEFHENGHLPERYTQPLIPAYISSLKQSLDETDNINRLLAESLLNSNK